MPILFSFPKKRTAAEKKRRRNLTMKAVCLWGCGLAAFMCLGLLRSATVDASANAGNEIMSSGTGRKLLSSEWNPMSTDVESMGPLKEAGAPLWLVLLIWLFAGVAIVTDSFFTPALEGISTSMGLTEDVAGATFLAAASSAPEFFTSLADTFASEGGGMGVGTIVGSAVFNILVIVAVSCIPCDRLNLDWYPLARDSLFYTIAIIMLLVFVLTGESKGDQNLKPTVVAVNVTNSSMNLSMASNSSDSNWSIEYQTIMTGSGNDEVYGVVEWYESMMLLLGYAGYITFMAFSGATKPKVVRLKDCCFKTNESGEYPEYDTHRDFSCQVVQQMDDEGEVLMLSTRAGDAMKPRTFSEPYGADSAHVMPLENIKSPHSARKQSAPPAVIPTPRRRRQWEREKQKWEAQQSTPQPESAFTRWVIEQRREDDDDSEGGMTPDGNTCAFDTFRGDLATVEPINISTVNETALTPMAPANSPTSERTGRTMELRKRIAELIKEKEEAKARDDLERAAELKAEIDALERKAFNVEDGSSAPSSKGGDSDDEGEEGEWKESTITVVKKDLIVIRSCGELGFEVDEGDEDDKDAKPVFKVCRARKRALEHGFKEEMEVVRVNDMKVTSLEEFEEAIQLCGNEDEVMFNTRIECELPFWDAEWPEDGEDGCMNCFWTFAWACILPQVYMFKATIPRADRRKTKNCYWAGFFMSIVWIGMLSMYMLKFATWIGAICRIDPTVMGIVVLAAGTSVPDAMASYCAAKMGMADMAVSNALGSNVFNIFAGLGFPWFLSAVLKGEPILVPKKGIVLPTLILFLILFMFLWTLKSYDFQLTPKVGKIFFGMMLVYWTWTLLNEFVIGIQI